MAPLTLLVVSVLSSGGNLDGVVLDFTATWCGPCQQISPIVSRLERQGYPIRKVDVDTNRDLVKRFNIQSIPAFVLVIDGVPQERLTGGQVTEDQLKRLCSRVPRPPESKSVLTAPVSTGATGAAGATADHDRKPAAAPRTEFAPPKTVPQVADKPERKFWLPIVNKKEEAPVVDAREGAIPRGKPYDSQASRPPVQGSPLAASVRIRVKDSQGEDVGSGTIIDSRVGATTVLTCGHIFRNWDKSCTIEVDYFGDGKMQTFTGTRVYHNLEDDVGLISMNVDPLPSCRVAPAGTKISKGSPVISVGCSGGDRPTEQALKITALNRYLGADNIECSGVPAQGRSGGGLFTKNGVLIGVCTAASPHNKEGLYAGLKTVQRLLEHCTLAHLYRPIGAGHEHLAADLNDEVERDESDELEIADDVEAPEMRSTANASKMPPRRHQATAPAVEGDEDAIREALEQAGEAEIVCIIRPIHQPRAASRVVILNRASRRFVAYLSDELDLQQDIHETTLTSKESKPRSTGETEATKTPPVKSPEAGPQEVKQPASRSSNRPYAPSVSDDDLDEAASPQPYRRKRRSPPAAPSR
jgi:thiol-disulfide isomerase/thioredoxin